jgi:hypothetical protein
MLLSFHCVDSPLRSGNLPYLGNQTFDSKSGQANLLASLLSINLSQITGQVGTLISVIGAGQGGSWWVIIYVAGVIPLKPISCSCFHGTQPVCCENSSSSNFFTFYGHLDLHNIESRPDGFIVVGCSPVNL